MSVSTDKKKIDELLERGVENVFPSKDYLRSLLMSGKRQRIYYGIDPTGPNLHLGHAVPLMKVREFQNLGHEIILLIGDFTGMIGDPTDKSATRVKLTREQVLSNAKKYKKQASKILDFKGENKPVIKYNSKWLGKLRFDEVIEIASNLTVPQLLHRDMFKKRMSEGKDIYLHEFFYPMMQGYDSVAMEVDGEVGGNDQTFNMLTGRDLMKKMQNKEKFVLASKLLVDPTGKKMGKSEGNMIVLDDSPSEMFGKVMSWTDEMIVPAFEILTRVTMQEIGEINTKIKEGENPKDFKMQLASEIVSFFHSSAKANKAKKEFESVFGKHAAPDAMSEFKISEGMTILEVLVKSKLASSKSEARRLILQRAVKLDDEPVADVEKNVKKGSVLKKGKRHFVRLV